mmetsp:Transcript_1571/g.2317  ORF Transcript_1571/g.2317 Transcript_1571/m.2317 type:complete len:108 (-) Transcript_1571:90-413(-)
MGSVNVTSGAYHESTMGLKNDVYSLARTRFSFVTVAANSSFSVVEDDDVDDPVASVVDMKSLLVCFCVEEEGGQNASAAGLVAARSSSSSEPKSDSAVDCFVIIMVA